MLLLGSADDVGVVVGSAEFDGVCELEPEPVCVVVPEPVLVAEEVPVGVLELVLVLV